jgi:hypothetical protein
MSKGRRIEIIFIHFSRGLSLVVSLVATISSAKSADVFHQHTVASSCPEIFHTPPDFNMKRRILISRAAGCFSDLSNQESNISYTISG